MPRQATIKGPANGTSGMSRMYRAFRHPSGEPLYMGALSREILEQRLAHEGYEVVDVPSPDSVIQQAKDLIAEKLRLFPDPVLKSHLEDLKSVLDQ